MREYLTIIAGIALSLFLDVINQILEHLTTDVALFDLGVIAAFGLMLTRLFEVDNIQ